MSAPGSANLAGVQASDILERALSGKRSNVERRVRFGMMIAKAIWKRWKVGPWAWQLKHVTWYLDDEVRLLSSSSRYDHWRAIRTLLSGSGQEHLILWLENRKNNGYTNPEGNPGKRGTGGRKPYLPKRTRASCCRKKEIK
jgi:hypothetical protein